MTTVSLFSSSKDVSPSPGENGEGERVRRISSISGLSMMSAFSSISDSSLLEGKTERSDSDILVAEYCKVPLHVRALAEAWELPRDEVQLFNLIAETDGTMVYQCRWRGLDCVAKVLSTISDSSREHADMINEVSTISRLRHPNLVLFLGACTRERPLIYVSEFLCGGNLEEWTKRQNERKPRTKGRAPLPMALGWCSDLSRAICYLHNCTTPVIHCNLKPANLLLTGDMNLKVSDFGLSKTRKKRAHRESSKSTRKSTSAGVTSIEGINLGSIRYVAPEVFGNSEGLNEKVDLYSIGMIFWYIATATEPFASVDVEHVPEAAKKGHRPPQDVVRERFGPLMCELIESCWNHNPAQRPPAEDLVKSLEAIAQTGILVKKEGTKCCVQ